MELKLHSCFINLYYLAILLDILLFNLILQVSALSLYPMIFWNTHTYIYILFWFVFGILSSLKGFSFKLGCFCSALNAWVLSPVLKCSFPSHLSLKCYKLHPVSLQAVRLLKCSLSCYQHYFQHSWYLSEIPSNRLSALNVVSSFTDDWNIGEISRIKIDISITAKDLLSLSFPDFCRCSTNNPKWPLPAPRKPLLLLLFLIVMMCL